MSVNNPPAFPIAVPLAFQHFDTGMTLRDYFAGQVAPAVLTKLWADLEVRRQMVDDVYKVAATASYEMADAMLAARSVGEGK
jgi:hypothetical protein